MLALIYLVAATYFGDRICRRFYRFVSIQQRIATSFLVGLLLSTWITYLGSLAFAGLARPLIAGNIVFLISIALVCYLLPRASLAAAENMRPRPPGSATWDWIFLAAFLVLASWLMFATLGFRDGQFQISFKSWTDFGANVSLVQTFALGRNFPTQHPFFPGELIRYHFLFWFQAGNLEFLGLNPVWSINLLSILALLSLLVLIATFAEVLFDSRVVGRLGASIFFFSSSLSYLPFLKSQSSFRGLAGSIMHAKEFLASGYPFRGETWGALSVNVFAFQRHLISGLGLFFVVLIFMVERYRARATRGSSPTVREGSRLLEQIEEERAEKSLEAASDAKLENDQAEIQVITAQAWRVSPTDLAAFIFSGVIIGLLPYWNSPIYVSALAIFGCAFLLFPRRLQTACMIAAALAFGLPQVLLLRSGAVTGPSLLHWGYTLEHPTVWLVLKYLGWTFGVKWILIAVALAFSAAFHRRWFIAFTSLLVIVFLFQLSTDIFNNHKLLNVWAILANTYAACALWRIGRKRIVGAVAAMVLGGAMIFGGVIDLFPLHNDPALAVPYQHDRLSLWLLQNTQPLDVFLTHTLLTHPILFTGRKIFLGYTLFAWTAGYDVAAREAIYRRLFEERDPEALLSLLRENKIAYVAIDDGVRHNETLYDLNEDVYEQNFEKVFTDDAHSYDNLTIYKVPSL